MCGLPGGGKSTWAKKHVEHDQNSIIVSKDDIRTMINGKYLFLESKEKVVGDIVQGAVLDGVENGYDVILDGTNITKESRMHWIGFAAISGMKPVIVWCKGDGNNLENRMKDPRGYLRGKWMSVIEDMESRFEAPVEDEECEVVVV